MAPSSIDTEIFAALLARARKNAPDCRAGQMFGAPAVFVGRKMAACALDGAIGLRVPAVVAATAVATGRADHFQPHGRKKMREWIAIAPAAFESCEDLLAQALDFARANDRAG